MAGRRLQVRFSNSENGCLDGLGDIQDDVFSERQGQTVAGKRSTALKASGCIIVQKGRQGPHGNQTVNLCPRVMRQLSGEQSRYFGALLLEGPPGDVTRIHPMGRRRNEAKPGRLSNHAIRNDRIRLLKAANYLGGSRSEIAVDLQRQGKVQPRVEQGLKLADV